ncbi:hypothetical protein [Paraburkholderia caballeronis]|uniref:hypothetical protein n=1 Tax=Paraburkholderia caballeronis TaxID=416943 RepID=UPI00089B0B54|nr:hypothetical protein [Paraburkholderia caballeronis]SEB47970.1 hypothetical protein SAMN05445871_0285 [Paraburkholderia caballeronis]
MKLTFETAPDAVNHVLCSKIPDVLRKSSAGRNAFDVSAVSIGALGPFPLYVADISASGAMSKPKFFAWRFLLLNGEFAISAADVSNVEKDHLVLSSVHFGRGARKTQEGIRFAQSVAGGSARMRLLSIPRMHMLVIWLLARKTIFVITDASENIIKLSRSEFIANLSERHENQRRRRRLTN